MLMRILQLDSLLTGGGTDDQCARFALGLHRLGHRVAVAGPSGREFSSIISGLGLHFHATPPEGLLKLRFILRATRLIRRDHIQIVHGHHGRDLWPTVLAARMSGSRPKIVLTRHLAKSPSSWFSRRFLLSQCDALIAVSHFVARVLREGVYEPNSPEPERRSRPPLVGDHLKIHVIHGGIDTEHFRPLDGPDVDAQRREWGLSQDHYAFAVVGGYPLPRGKGQREFLHAATRVHAQIPHARFLIIGRGNMEDILQADIERLGLAGKAWLTPYGTDMPRAMNAIDCLVHPQIGTEALPGVVIEAHACGKPVIASDLDGIPEAFAAGDYGQLVQRGSIEELSAALRTWAARPALDLAARRLIHEKVDAQFSLERAAESLAALYQSLLAEPSSAKV
jgi:glycosyltransferase involved in cell wall biosynthesis